ncbi:hypothetical protein [Erythrobacter sp. KY5]|nr:hypothetical protein [Erythrobacter sp. KY5]
MTEQLTGEKMVPLQSGIMIRRPTAIDRTKGNRGARKGCSTGSAIE